jgi:F0F1-type ATP synthase assembly protein I
MRHVVTALAASIGAVVGTISVSRYLGNMAAVIHLVTFCMVAWRLIRQDMRRRAEETSNTDAR